MEGRAHTMLNKKMMLNKTRKLQKKKGYTLIELLASLTIIVVILSIGVSLTRNVKTIINNQNLNRCSTSIVNIINYSKLYCRKADKVGFLNIDNISNEIYLYAGGKIVEDYHMPQGFRIETQGQILIDSNGVTIDACTIRYYDEFDKVHNISMCVGTAFVREWN